MSAEYKLRYDDGGMPGKVNQSAQAMQNLAGAGGTAGRAAADATEAVTKAGDAAEKVSEQTYRLVDANTKGAKSAEELAKAVSDSEKAISNLGKSVAVADQATEQFDQSVDKMTSHARAVQDYTNQLRSVGNATGEVTDETIAMHEALNLAKDAAGGLGTTLGIVKAAGLSEIAETAERAIKALNDFAKASTGVKTSTDALSLTSMPTLSKGLSGLIGTVGRLIPLFGSVIAITGSAATLYDALTKSTHDMADANSTLDGTILKLLNSMELLSDATTNLVANNKKEDEALQASTKAMQEKEKKAVELQKAIEKLNNQERDYTEEQRRQREIQNIKTLDEIERRIDANVDRINELAGGNKQVLEEIGKKEEDLSQKRIAAAKVAKELEAAEKVLNRVREAPLQGFNLVEEEEKVASIKTKQSNINEEIKNQQMDINGLREKESVTLAQVADAEKKNNELFVRGEEIRREMNEQAKKAEEEKYNRFRESLDKSIAGIKQRRELEEANEQAELEAIEARRQANAKAIEERKKKEQEAADARKKQEDEILAKIKGKQQQEANPPKPSIQTPSAPTSPAPLEEKNKYGEGTAPTAGMNQDNPYAEAQAGFGPIGSDFDFTGNSYLAAGGDSTGKDPFVDLADSINKKLKNRNVKRKAIEEEMKRREKEDNEKVRQELERQFGTSDEKGLDSRDSPEQFRKNKAALEKSYRDERRDAARGMNKNGITDDQREDAIKKITDETTQTFVKQNKLDETKQEFFGEVTNKLVEHGGKIVSLEQTMRSFINQLKGASQVRRSAGLGTAPSNARSQKGANP